MLQLHIQREEERAKLLESCRAQEKQDVLKKAQQGEAQYHENLGWLHVRKWADEASIQRLESLAQKIRQEADAFVLIGVGGSNNAARSVVEALKTEDSPEIVYAGNTLSPWAIEKMLGQLQGKSVCIDCIAKNFETLEPGAAFRLLRKHLYERYGALAGERILATGSRGSSLELLCKEKGYTFLEFPEDIGGRYSAITNVGLLPMAVAGIDIRELIRGAEDMELQLREQDEEENPAWMYACMRNLCWRNGYRIELLSSFEPQLKYFYKWWIQLFAESEGKDGKGLFPAAAEFSEELHSMGQFIQEGTPLIFETFLKVQETQGEIAAEPDGVEDGFAYLDGKSFQEINRAAYEATLKAHSRRLPCMEVEIGRLDAYHFGQLFYFFEFACGLSCRLMGVNPYDQPGVEAYKKEMFKALKH